MKQFVCSICACLVFIFGKAQPSVTRNPPLRITTNKTTSLIFPATIKHVDRGSTDVLAQQVKEAENILLVKAFAPRFKETNLSVVTSEGQLYSFDVIYDSAPPVIVYRFNVPPIEGIISFKNGVLSPAKIESYAKGVIDSNKSIAGIRNKKWDILARVNGIYIKDNVIFYQLMLNNQSQIDYDIEFLRFYIRDKKKGKRTASQEVEVKPLCKVGNTEVVKGEERNNIVVALEKFTIPDAKFLAIEIMEKNGGRNLLLKVKNNKIIKAISLSDLK